MEKVHEDSEKTVEAMMTIIKGISDYKEQRLTAMSLIVELAIWVGLDFFDSVALLEASKEKFIYINDIIENENEI